VNLLASTNPEALKLLEAHGITYLPEDTPASTLGSGSITLTEAGKLALKSPVKVTSASPSITITPTSSASTVGQIKKKATQIVSIG
jgi:hypothetical protein